MRHKCISRTLISAVLVGIGGLANAATEIEHNSSITSLSHSSMISAENLFDIGSIDKSIQRGVVRTKAYSYQSLVNNRALETLKNNIDSIMIQHSDKVDSRYKGISTLSFEDIPVTSLGVDLNFDVGKVLSSGTVIDSIIKTGDNVSLKYRDGVDGKYLNSLSFGPFLEGHYESNERIISFNSSHRKANDRKVKFLVEDKTSPIIERPKSRDQVLKLSKVEDVKKLERALIGSSVTLENISTDKFSCSPNIPNSKVENSLQGVFNPCEPEPTPIPTPTPPKSAPKVVNILFLAERSYIDTYGGSEGAAKSWISARVIDTLTWLNRAMINSDMDDYLFVANGVIDGNSQLALEFTPQSVPCTGHPTVWCKQTYLDTLTELVDNSDVIDLKLAYKADLTVSLRRLSDDGTYEGSVNGLSIELDTTDPKRARLAYAIAQLYPPVHPHMSDYQVPGENIAHEIGHLLGAGHSAQNDKPGAGINNRGRNATFVHTKGCATPHNHGFRTIMTYQYVCDASNDWQRDWPSNCGAASGHTCFQYPGFSNPAETTNFDGEATPARVGSSSENNRNTMIGYFPIVSNYDQHILPNRAPSASILVNATSLAVGNSIQFDGTGSSDPDGDRLTYNWQLTDSSNRVVTSSNAGAFNYTFEDSGNYTISLTVSDPYGLTNNARKFVSISLAAPSLYYKYEKNQNLFRLTWNSSPGSDIYQIWRKVGNGGWSRYSQSTTASYPIYSGDLTVGQTYYFRVKACSNNGDCGADSNTINIVKAGPILPPEF